MIEINSTAQYYSRKHGIGCYPVLPRLVRPMWRVLLGTRHGTSLPGTSHHYVDAKSPIYILLLNIFSSRVTRVTLVPCPNTTQSAQPERSRERSPSEATRSFSRSLREVSDAKMATVSTPARIRRPTEDNAAISSRPPSRRIATAQRYGSLPPS